MTAQHYPKIWFLRHGQTEWNKARRLQGQFDSPLTPQGVEDALSQSRIMPSILAQDPEIYVSPLGRAMRTAEIALGGAAYKTDTRLMEIDAGRWQGMYRKDIAAAHPEWADRSPNPLEIYEMADGGEGMAAFSARIASFLAGLTEPTAIVAHGLLGQVLRAQVRGLPLSDAGRLSNDQGCVYVLETGRETVLRADN